MNTKNIVQKETFFEAFLWPLDRLKKKKKKKKALSNQEGFYLLDGVKRHIRVEHIGRKIQIADSRTAVNGLSDSLQQK